MGQVIINEQWRSIDGYINYQVSNIGRVRNATTGRILKQCLRIDGYYCVCLYYESLKQIHLAHRLVANEFLEKHDDLNDYIIDHIDRNRTNNKVFNLRYATSSQNKFNQAKSLSIKSSSVFKDVYEQRGKWIAYITYKGKKYHLGSFDLEEEAAVSYNMKAVVLGGDYACLNPI